nr:hypothetical protein [Mesorhizobium sp. B2-8-5]
MLLSDGSAKLCRAAVGTGEGERTRSQAWGQARGDRRKKALGPVIVRVVVAWATAPHPARSASTN